MLAYILCLVLVVLALPGCAGVEVAVAYRNTGGATPMAASIGAQPEPKLQPSAAVSPPAAAASAPK